MLRMLIVASAAALLAGGVGAQEADREVSIDDPSIKKMAAASGVKPGDKMVCKRQAAPTGSRFGSRKICKTEAQWELLQDEARQETERLQQTGVISN